MTLSLNQRAHELADRLAADARRIAGRGADAARRDAGDRLRQRRPRRARGGRAGSPRSPWAASARSASRRSSSTAAGCPALTVVTDHPALACLASQYAGWKIDRDGYFAMASGPGRALIRAEDLYDDLDVDERASTAVLCLETGDEPPEELARVRGRARRRGAGRPHAAVRADGEPRRRRPGRRARRRDRAAQAARARVRHPARGERLRDLSAAAGGERPTRRRSGARTTRSSTAARSSSPSTRPTTSSRRSSIALPSSASEDHGEPFGKVLEEADWDFYAIDPLLFSPAEVRLVSVESGRSFHAGGVRARRARAVLPGMIVETVTTTINPDGTVNCAAMGVEWGDDDDRHQALSLDADAAQPPGPRRGGRQPHRRHPAVHAGRARGSAPADPAGGRRRRRRARRRVLVARGRGRRDRREPDRGHA